MATIHELDSKTLLETLPHLRGLAGHGPHSTIKPTMAQLAEMDTILTEDLSPGETLEELLSSLPFIELGEAERGDYTILRRLGQGGMGEVLLARQHALERAVAIKRLRSDRRHPTAIRQTLHEARIMGALEHPAIVPVYGFGRDEHDEPVLVMKRIEGESWERALTQLHQQGRGARALDEELVRHVEILIRVCHAVEYAHSRGILHRDIKPENVMLGAFDEVYLVDWGVAVREQEQVADATGLYPVVGTPHYMAPEMAHGRRSEPCSDLYLLGATLHQVLTGEPRHAGTSLMSVLFAASRSAPVEAIPGVPEELVQIMNRATHVEPAQRYETVGALREALEGFLSHRVAVRLSEQALSMLTQVEQRLLEDTSEASMAVRTSLAEVRFALQESGRVWPGNALIERGMARYLEAQCEVELRLGHVSVARELLARIAAPSAALIAHLEALERDREQEARHRQMLERTSHEHDRHVSSSQRGMVLVVVVALWAMMGVAAIGARWVGMTVTPVSMLWVGVGSVLAALLGLGLATRSVEWTAYNRSLILSLVLLSALPLLFRVVAWQLELTPDQMVRLEMIPIGIGAALVFVSHQLKAWRAILTHAALSVAAFTTPYAYELYTLGVVVLGGATAWVSYDAMEESVCPTQPLHDHLRGLFGMASRRAIEE